MGLGLLATELSHVPQAYAQSVQSETVEEHSFTGKHMLETIEEHSFTREHMLGEMAGIRPWLFKHGVTLHLQSDDEVWANVRGGTSHNAAYHGVSTVQVGIDLEKFIGLRGGIVNVSWLNIRGRSISQDQLADYNPVSGYEAYSSNRLLELWYQQSFWNDRMNVKIGQQALDNEFLVSDYASLFLNSNFGWPMAPSINLNSGGPSWPLASLGVRFQVHLTEQVAWQFAVADDNPTGHDFNNDDDPSNQSVHPHGDNFNLGGGALLISEFQYSRNPQPFGPSLYGRPAPGLPATYKVGGMYDTAKFYDQRYDEEGRSLADPASSGNAKQHRGNWILYALMDQMVWRPSLNSPRSVGVFARATGNPGDRNVVDFVMDAGINLNAPFKSRPYDVFGIGWGMGHTSKRARDADRDTRAYSSGYYPIRGAEHHIEVTYKAEITPWLSIQPDIQYIHRPGGGALNENTGRRARDELLFGVHTQLVL